MYYSMIVVSVVMFGGCFLLNDVYRRMRGSSLMASMEAAFIGSLAGLAVFLIINGLSFEYTGFTLIMSLVAAVNGIAFTFLSFKALDYINLSLYSVFSMLGGMVLPFAAGIFFYGEKFTVAKAVCLVFICAALAVTVTRGEKKKGYIYYAGVFVMNGMSGVLAKLFNELPFEKTSAAGYSIWSSICTISIAAVVWLTLVIVKKERLPKYRISGIAVLAVNGSANRVANFLLVLALLHVDASVQYPMVTGGVMIVSTLICFFGDRKPSKRELISVALSFVGLLALFLLPV